MKLFEYMGKEFFSSYGISVPEGELVSSPGEAADAVKRIGPAVLKAQVLTGKRGKAGGIAFAEDPRQAEEQAAQIIGSRIGDYLVENILLEQKMEIDQELYLSITVEGDLRCPVVLASMRGGVDIEEVPQDLIVHYPVDPVLGLKPFMAEEICRRLGLDKDLKKEFSKVLFNLYRLFKEKDAELVEINPLIVSGSRVFAADSKVIIDDFALFRHEEIPVVEERTELERRANELGLSFVQMDGDIAVIANGAGMSMATLDMLQYYGGNPSNFLDAGGGAGIEQTAQALELLLETEPKAVLINIFGGITRCDQVAYAIKSLKDKKDFNIPVVTRLVGTNEKLGREILEEINIRTSATMKEAVKEVVRVAYS